MTDHIDDEKYYGERQTVKQGGSIRVTIPADAVSDLTLSDGDYIGIYGSGDALMLLPKVGGGND